MSIIIAAQQSNCIFEKKKSQHFDYHHFKRAIIAPISIWCKFLKVSVNKEYWRFKVFIFFCISSRESNKRKARRSLFQNIDLNWRSYLCYFFQQWPWKKDFAWHLTTFPVFVSDIESALVCDRVETVVCVVMITGTCDDV